eukprot:292338_1
MLSKLARQFTSLTNNGAKIFLSYAWGCQDASTGKFPQQEQTITLHDELENLGHVVIVDKYDFYGSSQDQTLTHFMVKYINESDVFIPLLSNDYNISKNARKEFRYASLKGKDIIPLKVEPDFNFDDEIIFELGTKKWISTWDKTNQQVAKEINKELAFSVATLPNIDGKNNNKSELQAKIEELERQIAELTGKEKQSMEQTLAMIKCILVKEYVPDSVTDSVSKRSLDMIHMKRMVVDTIGEYQMENTMTTMVDNILASEIVDSVRPVTRGLLDCMGDMFALYEYDR